MDPFFQLYCCACHNYFMYCDCVHSYEDIIVEDDISHESEGGEDDFDDDFDDMEFPQPDADHPFDVVDDFFDPNKWKPTSGMSTDPSPGKRPKPDPGNLKPGPTILVDKPPADAGEGNKPSKQENVPPSAPGYQYTPWQDVINNNVAKPGKIPKKDPPTDDIKQVALSYFKNGVPYPYWTSPSVNSIMDAMNCPVYTGPQVDDVVFQKFVTDELYPWYEKLPDADKRTYLSACFVADPRDGVDQGRREYFHVSIKYDHHESSGRVEYPYIYQISPIIDGVVDNTDIRSVYSDKRLPARAFSNEESFDKYFQETKPGSGDYVCTYKQPRSTPPDPVNRSSLNSYRFYESSIADPPPYLPVIDPSIPDPPIPKPPRPDESPNWFVNSRGNTKSINGMGFQFRNNDPGGSGFLEPFFDAGYISNTLWKTNSNDPQYPDYPVGNVPNPNGFSGLFFPLSVSWQSYMWHPIDLSSTNVEVYPPAGQVVHPAFGFPCECICRGTSGNAGFYFVSVETKVVGAEISNFTYNAYSLKYVNGNPVKVYHRIYGDPIYENRPDGLPRVALEKMSLRRAFDSSVNVFLPGTIGIGSTFFFTFLVKVNDNDPYLDSTRGGEPYIFVETSQCVLQFIQLKTMIKDNSRTERVGTKALDVVASGKPLIFPTEFNNPAVGPGFRTRNDWYNRCTCIAFKFGNTPFAKDLALFRNYGQTGSKRLMEFINAYSGFVNRVTICCIYPYDQVGNLLSTDTWRVGQESVDLSATFPGFLQQHAAVLYLGDEWLPLDYTKKRPLGYAGEHVGPSPPEPLVGP